jgi:hypothetical protein
LQRVVTELRPKYAVVALAIRKPPFDELPDTVAAAWNSSRLRYAADGMMYQQAMCNVARELGLDVHLCVRREETSRAAEQLAVTAGEIETFVAGAGRPEGPPWTQEHRHAYAAGIAALSTHERERLRISAR